MERLKNAMYVSIDSMEVTLVYVTLVSVSRFSMRGNSRGSSPAYYANARARKLATPLMVLSVLAPMRASGISRHSFGQG